MLGSAAARLQSMAATIGWQLPACAQPLCCWRRRAAGVPIRARSPGGCPAAAGMDFKKGFDDQIGKLRAFLDRHRLMEEGVNPGAAHCCSRPVLGEPGRRRSRGFLGHARSGRAPAAAACRAPPAAGAGCEHHPAVPRRGPAASPPALPCPRPAAKPLPRELAGELSQLVGRGCQLCQAALRMDGAKVVELMSRDPASFSAGACVC